MLSINSVFEQLGHIQQTIQEHLRSGHSRYLVPDPMLGWNIAPESTHHSLPYRSNAFGFRRVPSFPDPNTADQQSLRIAFFGDSLVHGDEVADSDCWISRLQEKLPQHQLFNAGVPGYGTDQALLRLESCTLEFDWIFLGLALCDETRNINILRMHRSEHTAIPFMKPRFVETPDGLEKVTPPFADFHQLQENYLKPETQAFLKQYDFYYPAHPYWSHFQGKINRMLRKINAPVSWGSDPFKMARTLTFKILERFSNFCLKYQKKATVLLIPTEYELQGESLALNEYVQKLSQNSIPFWDLREAFHEIRSHARSELWCPQGHFSPKTSEWVADFLARKIK